MIRPFFVGNALICRVSYFFSSGDDYPERSHRIHSNSKTPHPQPEQHVHFKSRSEFLQALVSCYEFAYVLAHVLEPQRRVPGRTHLFRLLSVTSL